MGFKLLILRAGGETEGRHMDEWPDKLRRAVPGIEVSVCDSTGEAMELIEQVDAAFGDLPPELFDRAKNLRWIACPQAGPRAGYYHARLIDSDVVVTNTRQIYNDHISAHIMSYVLAFARGLHVYIPRQLQQDWRPDFETVDLPGATAIVIGVGGIGGETARLCAEFGMNVLAVDPRVTQAPPGVAELHKPDAMDDILHRGDFVIVTVPETPETQGLFSWSQFAAMKSGAYFINIGRGATVILDDLDEALRNEAIAGAALDVFKIEPLPSDHPLWTAPGILITPHVAGRGPHLDQRRTDLFIENCVRFDERRPLNNVVDKSKWF